MWFPPEQGWAALHHTWFCKHKKCRMLLAQHTQATYVTHGKLQWFLLPFFCSGWVCTFERQIYVEYYSRLTLSLPYSQDLTPDFQEEAPSLISSLDLSLRLLQNSMKSKHPRYEDMKNPWVSFRHWLLSFFLFSFFFLNMKNILIWPFLIQISLLFCMLHHSLETWAQMKTSELLEVSASI